MDDELIGVEIILDNLSEMVCIVDIKTNELLYRNNAYAQLYGDVLYGEYHEKNNDYLENEEWEYNEGINKSFKVKEQPLIYKGRDGKLSVLIDISVVMNEKESLKKYLEYEKNIINVLSNYMGHGNINLFFENTLQAIGEYLSVIGVYIFTFDFEKQEYDCTHEWTRNPLFSVKKSSRNIPMEGIQEEINQIINDGYFHIENIDDIKDKNPEAYKLLRKPKKTSVLDVLLNPFGKPYGFIGIDYHSDEVEHSLIKQELEIIARTISNSIEKYMMQENIQKLLYCDSLTGICNREGFLECVRSWENEYTLFFMDVNKFKVINDTYGHEVGDVVLVNVAQKIKVIEKRFLDVACCVGRYGGDEFVLAIETVDMDKVTDILQLLRGSIAFSYDEGVFFQLSLSIGYIQNNSKETVWNAIQKADYAMYASKRSENNIPVSFEHISNQYEIDLMVMQDFKKAIKKKEMYIVFQPKVDIEKNEIIGCEALCRWNYNGTRELTPDQFIHVVERTGKMHLLDLYVLEEVCLFLSKLRERGITHKCSVNLSLKTLHVINVEQDIINMMDKYKIPSSSIVLEIVEDIFEADDSLVLHKIELLRKRGIEISIDDFGLGYSSLSRLCSISFDELKIPREFIKDIENPIIMKVFELILSLSRNLTVRTIVEGVETEKQILICRERGATCIQGYYYSKPLKEEHYIQYVMNYGK